MGLYIIVFILLMILALSEVLLKNKKIVYITSGLMALMAGLRFYTGYDFLSYSNFYQDVDGLITNEPGLCLTTFYADCVPLFFVDPVHKAIGLSHSGWSGTVGKMGQETLLRMKEEYGTEAEDVFAAVGPSICQDCYEVSEDVIEKLYNGNEKEGLEVRMGSNSKGKQEAGQES